MNYNYKCFEIYERPTSTTKHGVYVCKTAMLVQAVVFCEKRKKNGKSYFIIGVTESGQRVILL